MTKHERFDWDEIKARRNQRQHGIRFEQAMRVLADTRYLEFHVERFDANHSDDEDRFITVGSDPYSRDIVLVVIWTDREDVTRIISARVASQAERNAYETEIQGRQNHS